LVNGPTRYGTKGTLCTFYIYHPSATIEIEPSPPILPSPSSSQTAHILNSTFVENSARVQGGGIYSQQSTLTVTGSSFRLNNAKAQGGALQANGCAGGLYVSDCSFDSNRAGGSGGAVFLGSCNASFETTALMSNSAGEGGALSTALDVADSDKPGHFKIILNDCLASNNSAYSSLGGCVRSKGVNLTLQGGAWVDNTAASGGGALACSGGCGVEVQGVKQMRANRALLGPGGVVSGG